MSFKVSRAVWYINGEVIADEHYDPPRNWDMSPCAEELEEHSHEIRGGVADLSFLTNFNLERIKNRLLAFKKENNREN